MKVDAFRRLFPLRFHERHLLESVRPDARPLGKARETSLALGLSKLSLISNVLLLFICASELMFGFIRVMDQH